MDNKDNLITEKKVSWSDEQEKKQQELGKQMDEYREYANWLKENKEILQDPKYILYRLPLTHQQRENVYQNLVKEAKEKKEKKETKDESKANI